jgi:DNA-binding transcriptional regulator YhcF (GntR family)
VRVPVDTTRPEPPYEQLKSRITEQVDSGELAAGERLPTVRALAGELGLAPNTVARAYRELEALGVLSTRGRSGTFVSGDGVTRAAREAAATYADTVRALGVAPAEALALVERALAQNSPQNGSA